MNSTDGPYQDTLLAQTPSSASAMPVFGGSHHGVRLGFEEVRNMGSERDDRVARPLRRAGRDDLLACGGGKYVAAVHADGVIVGKAELLGAAVPSRPAKPGEVVAIYCTGLRLTGHAGDSETISTDPGTRPDLAKLEIYYD